MVRQRVRREHTKGDYDEKQTTQVARTRRRQPCDRSRSWRTDSVSGGGSRLTAARPPVHFHGLINDYTPSAAVTAGGPYEMRGKWSLEVDHRHATAEFSAEINMETSDYGITQTIVVNGVTQPSVNKDDPTTRGAHTHHISMTDGVVTSDWSSCPKFKPAVTEGFVVTGTAFITGNGSPRPVWQPVVADCVRPGRDDGQVLEHHHDAGVTRDQAFRDTADSRSSRVVRQGMGTRVEGLRRPRVKRPQSTVCGAAEATPRLRRQTGSDSGRQYSRSSSNASILAFAPYFTV